MKVLIADDSNLFRLFVRQWLGALFPHVEILEAADAPDALGMAIAHVPPLVFLDIEFPSGSGLDVATEILERLPGTAVIVCTAHDTEAHRRVASDRGALLFVSKARIDTQEVRKAATAALGIE